jgi:hypothetical protein
MVRVASRFSLIRHQLIAAISLYDRQTYAHNELVNYLIQSSNPQIFVAVNSILNIVGNPSSRDDFLDTASRISHDTRTSIDSNMDSNATLKDLKMSCLQYMGNFRFDADK